MGLEREIFSGKTFSNLLEEIYTNSKETRKQIRALITQLKDQITSPSEALALVPMVHSYLESGIKNDDMLVKLANIVQKIEAMENSGSGGMDDFGLGEIEKLIKEQEEFEKKRKRDVDE